MLRTYGKKINAAFKRLRDRRAAVGKVPKKELTPEQEAARLKQDILLAQQRGDISTILKLMVSTSSLTATDYIEKSCGNLLYFYYTYVENIHQLPIDVIDMVDGILYLEAKSYVQNKKATEDK